MTFDPQHCPYTCPAGSNDWSAHDLERHILRVHGDMWLPASMGQEEPITTRTGRRLLYCWQPRSGAHAYLDLDTDLILSDPEARLAMGD